MVAGLGARHTNEARIRIWSSSWLKLPLSSQKKMSLGRHHYKSPRPCEYAIPGGATGEGGGRGRRPGAHGQGRWRNCFIIIVVVVASRESRPDYGPPRSWCSSYRAQKPICITGTYHTQEITAEGPLLSLTPQVIFLVDDWFKLIQTSIKGFGWVSGFTHSLILFTGVLLTGFWPCLQHYYWLSKKNKFHLWHSTFVVVVFLVGVVLVWRIAHELTPTR